MKWSTRAWIVVLALMALLILMPDRMGWVIEMLKIAGGVLGAWAWPIALATAAVFLSKNIPRSTWKEWTDNLKSFYLELPGFKVGGELSEKVKRNKQEAEEKIKLSPEVQLLLDVMESVVLKRDPKEAMEKAKQNMEAAARQAGWATTQDFELEFVPRVKDTIEFKLYSEARDILEQAKQGHVRLDAATALDYANTAARVVTAITFSPTTPAPTTAPPEEETPDVMGDGGGS